MDLNKLTANLRAQADATSTIVLNDTVFADEATRTGIRSAFALFSGEHLTIKGVKAEDIPDPSADGVLTISAGTTSVFKQSDVGVNLTFTSRNGDALQATIVTEMDSSWEFKKSFEGLDRYPFNLLKTSEARFVYTTVEQPQYAWPGDASKTIKLEPGLNFLSNVTFKHLSTILPTIKSLLEPLGLNWDLSFIFHGPFRRVDNQPLPVGKIRAKLGDGKFEVGAGDHALKLEAPAIAVRIDAATEDDPSQRIDLAVEGHFNTLEVAVGIPLAGGGFEVSTTPLPHSSSIDAVIRSLPGGAEFSEYIPSELNTAFSNVGLENFTLFVSPQPKVTYLGLSLSTLQEWEIITNFLTLKKLRLEIQTLDPAGRNWTRAFVTSSAKFLKEVFKEDFNFTVELEKQDSWEVKSVNGSYYGAVSLGDIARKVLARPELVPSVLNNLVFSDFGVHLYREAKGKPFSYSFSGSVEASLKILDTQVGAVVHLTAVKTDAGHDLGLKGGLATGEQTFPFQLELGKSTAKLQASWESDGTPLGFGDIARAFGWDDMPPLPQGFDLGLDKAKLIYDFKARKIALSAHSVNYGQIFFASTGNGAYVLAIDVPLDLKFSNAPVLGDNLHIDPPVGIDELQIIVTSKTLADEEVKNLNALLKEEFKIEPLIPKTLAEGLTIAAKLQMGGTRELVLPLTGGAKKDESRLLAGESEAAPYQADPKWFELKKTFGPVYFDKIGVQYQNATLRFLLNAALSAAGLTLSVDGLSVGSSLTRFAPEFDLRGLGIDYKGGDVQIGGAFLRTVKPGEAGKPDTCTYDGAAVIKTKQFTLSAIGSYTKLEEQPSLFIYAFLNYPLGGPSFFFVTGLAAGFGYNRRLIAPSIEKVAEFPLIKQALGKAPEPKDVTAALTTLRTDIPPSLGSIFLAVGVKFNSFKLVDSFALLTIEFGNDLAINLLGISKAVVPTPEAGGKAVTPLAQVEIAWKASFNPKDGCLGIDARLTPNSYILSKDCRLTGGYAFYSWFIGPHAGDFVQTLGGYHPRFTVPEHYPKVPRLAFDWRVSNALTIQGDAYYALTGSALMAGGHLEVLYRQGELRAWLKVGADFLIAWKPYHYDASLYVNVGASYTFDIDLLFGHIRTTISVDVGAQLHLWGPDFSGTATIDLSVISFTIAFGAGASQTPAPISWTSFQQSFLPAKEEVCSISLKDGLVRKLEAGGKDRWIINPKNFALVVDSAFPYKSAPPPITGGKDLADGATVDFGIAPMAVSATDLSSKFTVTIRRGRDRDREVVNKDFDYVAIRKRVPAGLWGKDMSPDPAGKVFIENVPSGVVVTPRKQPARREIATIDLSVFKFSDTQYTRGGDPAAFVWEQVSPFQPLERPEPRARRDEIKKGVERNSTRDALLSAMGVKVTVNIRKEVADEFVGAPQVGKNI